MSDEDLITEAIRAANVDEEPVVDESVDDGNTEVEPEVEERVWAGKFQDPDALENAYLELQRKFHESRQPEPEPESEYLAPEPKFFGNEPATEDDLVAFAEQDPTNAAMWVLENKERLPEDLSTAVLEHWWRMRPWEAMQLHLDQRLAAEREDIAGMTMPLVEQHERAVMSEAYEMLVSAVPDYEDYQSRVEDFIDQNDVSGILPPGAESDPVALAEGIGTIVGIIKWREYQSAMRNQGMIVPDNEPTQAPMVSTKNTTNGADITENDMDDLIRNMILNA